jgi:hypothetical protein
VSVVNTFQRGKLCVYKSCDDLCALEVCLLDTVVVAVQD